jgi:hypothetical protein
MGGGNGGQAGGGVMGATDLTSRRPSRSTGFLCGLPAVCWLTSGLDRARVIGLCIERGWTIEGMERAA